MRRVLTALTALTLLVVDLGLLTWPAQSADLAFTCSGAFKPSDEKEPPRTIFNETLFIGLASKTVWGVIGLVALTRSATNSSSSASVPETRAHIQRASSIATQGS